MCPNTTTDAVSRTDYHLHAGAERPEGETAADFLNFAKNAGMIVTGITDHWQFFCGNPKNVNVRHYETSLDGYARLAGEVAAFASQCDGMQVLFGPEMLISELLEPEAELAFTAPEVTYFLAEQNNWHPWQTHGEHLLEGARRAAQLRERFGRPALMAHPLRKAILDYGGKPVGFPERPQHSPMAPLVESDDPVRDVGKLFDLDLRALCRGLRELDMPMEVNGSSWRRAKAFGDPSFEERMVFFFRVLLDEGVRLLPGSDRHSRHAALHHVELAERIGLTSADIRPLVQG